MKTLTKSKILESLCDLGAYEAIDELSGMLSLAIEQGRTGDIQPIQDSMRSIEKDLERWADLNIV